MLSGLRRSLQNRGSDSEGRLQVLFFITDGQISNEREIFREVKSKLGDTRLFTLGIGSSPNRYVLEEMANLGRGDSLFTQFDQEPQKAIDEFFSKISNPYLVDLELEDPNGVFEDVLPKPLPDLFIDEPLYITARFDKPGNHSIAIEGKLGGKPWREQLVLDGPKKTRGPESLGRLWARRKIQQLMRNSYGNPEEQIRKKIVDISKRYSVMSQYTSFVAVEKKLVRNPSPEDLKSIDQPVELPQGMQREGVESAIVDAGSVRNELVDANSSRKRSKPGDPLLTVNAPRSATDVVAHFPGHGRRLLDYDSKRGAWTARFMLPRDYGDDVYTVTVKVIFGDGRVEWKTVNIAVDSMAPKFEVEHLTTEDNTHRLLIRPGDVETLDRNPAPNIDVDIDIRRFRITLPDNSYKIRRFRHLEKRSDGKYLLAFDYQPDAKGPFEVQVEAMDWARNRYGTNITVAPESKKQSKQ